VVKHRKWGSENSAIFDFSARQRTFYFAGAPKFYYTTYFAILSSEKLYKNFNQQIPEFVQKVESAFWVLHFSYHRCIMYLQGKERV